MIDDKYKTDLPDRNAQKAVGVIQTITFAPVKVDPNYADPKIRQAISMAIDRDDHQADLQRHPRARHRLGLPGRRRLQGQRLWRVLHLRPGQGQGQARRGRRLQGGKMTIAYNADASHKEWVDAICNTIKNALGVDCVATPVVDFATFRGNIDGGQEDDGHVPHRLADGLPVDRELPRPAVSTDASSNDGRYSNPEFDKLLTEARADGRRSGHRQVPAGRGAPGQGHAGHPAVVLHRHLRLVRQGHRREDDPFSTIDFSSVALK